MPRSLSVEEFASLKAKEPKSFSPDEFAKLKAESSAKKVPYTGAESAARGLAQGLTLNSSDELSGIAAAAKDTIEKAPTKFGMGGELGGFSPAMPGQEKFGLKELVQSYRGGRDEARIKDAQARKDNPVAYKAADVGGSLLLSAIPAAAAAKGAGFLSTIGKGMKTGAAAAAGASDADLTRGEVENFSVDVRDGALTGGAVYAGGKAVGIGADLASKYGAKAAKALLRVGLASQLPAIVGSEASGAIAEMATKAANKLVGVLREKGEGEFLGAIRGVQDLASKGDKAALLTLQIISEQNSKTPRHVQQKAMERRSSN